MTVLSGGQSKEKWRPIETVFRTKLCELLGCCLVAQDRSRRIARDEFDQESDKRNNRPDHEHEKAQATEHSENFAVHQVWIELPTADDSRMCLRAAIEESNRQ
jgi:hypothetical protein